jgi:hypothetical protein
MILIRNFSSSNGDTSDQTLLYTEVTGFGFTAYKTGENVSAEDKSSIRDKQLLFNFSRAFPTIPLHSKEEIERFVQISSDGKKFLLNYNTSIAGLLTMPSSFHEMGVTLVEWDNISRSKISRGKILAAQSSKISALSSTFRKDVERIGKDVKLDLEKYQGLEVLLSINAQHLDVKDQVRIAACKLAGPRKAIENEAIKSKQKELITYYRENNCFPDSFSLV